MALVGVAAAPYAPHSADGATRFGGAARDDGAGTKPMAGAMGVVFLSLGVILFLAAQANAAGSSSMAIFIIGVVVVLFTLVDVEFGIYCLVAGMLLSPEVELSFIHIPSRAVVIRIDDLMIILVSLAWFAQIAVRGKLDKMVSTPLNKAIFSFTFITVISTIRGCFTGAVGSPLTAFFFVLKITEFFVLYFLIVNTVSSEAAIRRIMKTYFLTLLIVVAYATWMTIITNQIGRATTPFETSEEPGTLGGYLLFSFALAFGLLNYAPGVFSRLIYGGIMCAIIPPFLYTLSRGSYLAFFPMFLTVLFLSRRKVIPIILLIAALVALPYLPEVTIERVQYTFKDRIENIWSSNPNDKMELDPSSMARLERYDGVMMQWQYQPLIGQGVTGVGFVDSQIIRVLGEVGILGLLSLIWIFKSLFQTAIHLYRWLPPGYMKGLTLGMIAGTAGLIFHGATANTFTVVRIAGPFWALAGMIIVVYKIHEEEMSKGAA